jgi:hypothetical protein
VRKQGGKRRSADDGPLGVPQYKIFVVGEDINFAKLVERVRGGGEEGGRKVRVGGVTRKMYPHSFCITTHPLPERGILK